ncbi:MAG: TonB family protein [Abyssibacter sp.]|uniref:energy transducer TonB n=1 Tax=Abyssibacter sp. TaxID=2320200 RepID=UPI003219E786
MSKQSETTRAPEGTLRQAIGHSAEYVIALALLAVCLAVGVVVWLGQNEAPEGVVTELSLASDDAETAAITRMQAEEEAALAALRAELRDSLTAVEARGRIEAELAERERLAAEERAAQLAALEAQRREAAALRERLESEQARLRRVEQQRAEAAAVAQRRTAAQPAPSSTPTLPEQPATATPAQPQPVKVALSPAREPVITKPEVRWESCDRPQYPRASLRAEEEGVTVVSLQISADGLVTSGSIRESSGHRRLDEETLTALSRCRFKPATTDGVPTATTGIYRFAWNLR